VKGTIGKEDVHLEAGDVVVIPAGELHHFRNDDELPAITFNVYSPPEYPEDEKG
jgi:mannose-6-phosphate isomerase-like protein (cupin superfamily)